MPDDINALAVVTANIGIAHSLNLKVVAEGIETEEQRECLSTLGCQFGQGYLFSKPVPAVKAAELLKAERAWLCVSSAEHYVAGSAGVLF